MIRRGYDTVLQAVSATSRRHTGLSAAQWPNSTKRLVADLVMAGARMQDAWRQALNKKNPR